MKLFMLKIGARPAGRLIEQHDVMFVLARQLTDVIPVVNQAWPAVKNTWHLDAWREVRRVGDYQVALIEQATGQPITEAKKAPQLYFVNLGGYLPGQFEEFHYKTLVVADSIGKATAQVKQSDFYRDFTFDNPDPSISGIATSHVDDKHALDLDDIHCVGNLLPNPWVLQLTRLTPMQQQTFPEDSLHIGYVSLKSLRAQAKSNQSSAQ